MSKNIEAPVSLAASVAEHFKKGSSSILAACSEIATAFTALEEGAWTEQEFRSFFDRLAEESIGKGSGEFLKTDKKGITTFDPKPKAGVIYQMMAVGRCPGLNTPEFVAANRTAAYATLYRLTVLYNHLIEKGSGSLSKKQDRAQKAIISLVKTHGAALTRKEVDEAIAKAKEERRSRAPVEPVVPEPPRTDVASGPVVLTDLLQRDERYDVVVMTPSEEFLTEASESSLGTLLDRAPYQDLRKAESQAVLIGSGRQIAGLKKLAEATGDLTFCYCVRARPDARHVIDISKELIVFASSPLDGKATLAPGETADEFVRRLVAEGTDPALKKLHLFAGQQTPGWDTCGVADSTKEA